ncbi:MAG: NAD(P)H-hydrate dehydratase, partial [Cyanobacteria bacterium J06641_5]
VACPETDSGAIAQLPFEIDLRRYDAVVCGPGLTLEPGMLVVEVLNAELPLVLDADGLSLLAQQGVAETLHARSSPLVLTPHLGEFKRLFPAIDPSDRLQAVQAAAALGAIVLLKGARTVVAQPEGHLWVVPDSTPALARGGSGDVLAGLLGGLLAPLAVSEPETISNTIATIVATAAWWHARAGFLAARDRTVLGVDPVTLAATLNAVLAETVKDATGLGDN